MPDFIPFDIQKEIIKRVPDVKSLTRFRSVSKSWKSFINSPQFIAGYDVRLSQPHRLILRSPFKTTVFGFGVSPITCDPTIVKISYINRNDMDNIPWFIYWAAYDRIVADDGISRNKHMIMSFDLITKAFKLNEMPKAAVCGVWMMVHDGVITSFRRIFTIDNPISSVNEILGFRKCGEPIIETRKHGSQIATFEIYEPRSQHITNLRIYGEDSTFFMSSCMESLILLDHSDCSIY
ncbi:probable LRR receptor-like serine/threonine-protein kinase isoform X2 [Tanacetum coccineum]